MFGNVQFAIQTGAEQEMAAQAGFSTLIMAA